MVSTGSSSHSYPHSSGLGPTNGLEPKVSGRGRSHLFCIGHRQLEAPSVLYNADVQFVEGFYWLLRVLVVFFYKLFFF